MNRSAQMITVAVAGGVAVLGLTACNPSPGEGRIEVSGAEEVAVDGPAVSCSDPGDPANQWTWEGPIDGQESAVIFGSMYGEVVDTGVLQVGLETNDRWYAAWASSSEGEVVEDGIDEDGTLHAHGTLVSVDGEREVQIKVDLRCPD
jgi:hypothetical protein